jgi:hypothetical protein
MDGEMLLFGIGRGGFVRCELDGFDCVVSVPPKSCLTGAFWCSGCEER